jgi:hypothetical protein
MIPNRITRPETAAAARHSATHPKIAAAILAAKEINRNVAK